MDVKTINERITLLQNQRAQTISNVHALDGAIQDTLLMEQYKIVSFG